MGNRAVITTEGSKVGIYLHWNGGEESVTAFLRAAKDLGVRSPSADQSYFYARMCQIIGNFFGGSLSVGIDSLDTLDCNNGDNGLYVIGPKFDIVERRYVRSPMRAVSLETQRAMSDKHDAIYAECMAKNAPIYSPPKSLARV
jgi:hypothetical protein